jgi:hypothetical protein
MVLGLEDCTWPEHTKSAAITTCHPAAPGHPGRLWAEHSPGTIPRLQNKAEAIRGPCRDGHLQLAKIPFYASWQNIHLLTRILLRVL